MIYENILRNNANVLIEAFVKDNIIFKTQNGPYIDDETKVRAMSHLAVIMAVEIKNYQREDLIPSLERLGSKILAYGHNGLFIMRKKEGKDVYNGVIGHAWLLEGLLYIYSITKDNKYLDSFKQIIDNHLFNESVSVWYCPNTNIIYDHTLNHQLWYAAILSKANVYLKSEKYEKEISKFLDNLLNNMRINKKGRINHYVQKTSSKKEFVKLTIKHYIYLLKEFLNMPSLKYKENGYHIFNLVALARIYEVYPEHSIFCSKKIKTAFDYCSRNELKKGLMSNCYKKDVSLKNKFDDNNVMINIYGIPYNVPGFELMYISKIMPSYISQDVANYYFEQQIKWSFTENGEINENIIDKNIFRYRIYEYYLYL